jgi:hypothetical protein
MQMVGRSFSGNAGADRRGMAFRMQLRACNVPIALADPS